MSFFKDSIASFSFSNNYLFFIFDPVFHYQLNAFKIPKMV